MGGAHSSSHFPMQKRSRRGANCGNGEDFRLFCRAHSADPLSIVPIVPSLTSFRAGTVRGDGGGFDVVELPRRWTVIWLEYGHIVRCPGVVAYYSDHRGTSKYFSAANPHSGGAGSRGVVQLLLADSAAGNQRECGQRAMMAKIAGHVWSFDELFAAVLMPA